MLMIDGKESLILVGIVGGFLVIFVLFVWFPGIVMHDGFSHQFDNSDQALIFDRDGSVKDSFWSRETMTDLWSFPEPRTKAMYKPGPIKLGELQENLLTD
jgi:hypothetical protein